MDAGNDDAYRDAELVEHRLAELELASESSRHRIGDAKTVELAGMLLVAARR